MALNFLRDKISKVNLGTGLATTGFAGVLLLDSWFYAPFAVINAVGAALIFDSDRNDSVWSLGLAAVLGSWTLLMLFKQQEKLVLTTILLFIWFMGEANIHSTLELYNTGNIGKKTEKPKQER